MESPHKLTMAPLKRKTRLYEDIVQQFMKKIEDGELKAGDRLPTERELVLQLGVSRTSIREALRAMELLGIIESKVSEGTFIKPSGVDRAILSLGSSEGADERRTLEMYEIRLLLETYGARQAARNRADRHLEDLRLAIEAMKEEIARGSRGREGDKRFHKILAEAAGNGILLSILSLCDDMIDSSIAVANAHVNTNDIIEEHQKMYDAVLARDEKAAERLMRAHVKRALERTRFIVGEDGGE